MTKTIIGIAFTIDFDTQRSSEKTWAEGAWPTCMGHDLMERLAAKGFVAFELRWERTFVAQLAVEDDVIYLCDAVNELADFEAGKNPHYVHLGDGGLEVTSMRSDGSVVIDATHTPHLDRRFQRKYTFEVSFARYASAWCSVIRDLETHAT